MIITRTIVNGQSLFFSGIARNSQRWNHQKNDRENRDKTEPLAMLAKRQFRRGVGKFGKTTKMYSLYFTVIYSPTFYSYINFFFFLIHFYFLHSCTVHIHKEALSCTVFERVIAFSYILSR